MQNWKALLKEPTWTAAEVFPGVDGSWIGGRTGGKGYKERQHQDPHLAHGEEALALAPHFALISVRQVIRQAGARRRSPGRRKRHFLQLEPGHQPRPPWPPTRQPQGKCWPTLQPSCSNQRFQQHLLIYNVSFNLPPSSSPCQMARGRRRGCDCS